MRRFTIAAAAIVATAAVPTTAQADRADCPRKLERSYSKLYRQVANRHGTRAPGRNIRENGMLVTWGRKGRHRAAFDAMCSELRRSRRQLKQLLAPPEYPTLITTAVPPPQRPAGTQSSGWAAGSTLEAIAACESGGSPTAVGGPGGIYRGKYQFDYGTWASVGGSGDPAAASEAEQDKRAAMLYAQRGSSPWPVCGR